MNTNKRIKVASIPSLTLPDTDLISWSPIHVQVNGEISQTSIKIQFSDIFWPFFFSGGGGFYDI